MARAIMVLAWLALAGPARAEAAEPMAAAEVKCARKSYEGTPLFFKLRRPVKEKGEAARAILRERLPRQVLWCTRKGEMYVNLSKRDAVKLLGRHVVYKTVKGAGNDVDADAGFVDVSPASFVPDFLKDHVVRIWFDDDPKFDFTGPHAKQCE